MPDRPGFRLFVRRECHLCESARQVIEPVAARLGVPLELSDVDDPTTDPLLRALYDHHVPVLHYGAREIGRYRFEAGEVEAAVHEARAIWQCTLCVLAKYPHPGRVKTRLTVGQGAIRPETAARVHGLFLLRTLHRFAALMPRRLVLAFDGGGDSTEASRARFGELVAEVPGVILIPQSAGDLGDRLASAHQALGAEGDPVLFFGVDAPDLPESHLGKAAQALTRGEEGDADAVLGPTDDGGYWTLGIRQPVAARGDSQGRAGLRTVLQGVPWSSGRELAVTLERLGRNGYRVSLGETWQDVDHPSDLQGLLRRLASVNARPDDRAFARDLLRVLQDPHP